MNVSSILFIVVILLLLYYLIRNYYSTKNNTTTLLSGTQMTTINSTDLDGNSSGISTTNFSYSVWFFVNDWNYKYGEPKVIFERTTSSNPVNMGGNVASQLSTLQPCPVVSLGEINNDINISLTVYPSTPPTSNPPPTPPPTPPANFIIQTCTVSNIPIQKWVNLLISVYGRSMDVYLDGKLVKTFVLDGIAYINNSSNVYITPNGGFNGWTSSFNYYANPTDPQTAWNIYKKGYGGTGGIGNYQVKVSLVKDGSETKSLTI